jgi:prepilin-type N-terminal cleavage/methylation domain-containing protein
MNRPGFTLIELVVALTITGLVLTSGYAALATIVGRRAGATAAFDESVRAAAARRSLRAWIAGVTLTVEEDDVLFRGLDGVHGNASDDELTFRTSTATPLNERGATVRLLIDRSDSTGQTGLVAEISGPGGGLTRRVELTPHASELNIRYLTSTTPPRVWEASWVSATMLPVAVELVVGASAADSLPALLRLPVLVPVGAYR